MGFYACLILVLVTWSICTTGVVPNPSAYNPPCYGRCCSRSMDSIRNASNEMKLGLMLYDTYSNGACSMDYVVKPAPDVSSSCHKVQGYGKTVYVCRDDSSYPPGEGHYITDDEGEYCYISFQGSTTETDWSNNWDFSTTEMSILKPGKTGIENIFVHGGFYETWLGIGVLAVAKAKNLGCLSSTKKIHIIGHSLGGASADLTYLHIKTINNGVQLKVTTFGQPNVIFSSLSTDNTVDELLWENDFKTAYVRGNVRQSSEISYYWHDMTIQVPPGKGWHILNPSSKAYLCEVSSVEWETGPISYQTSSDETVTTVRTNGDNGACKTVVAPINRYLALLKDYNDAQKYTPKVPLKQPNTKGDMLQQTSELLTSVTSSLFDSFESKRDEAFAMLYRFVDVIAR